MKGAIILLLFSIVSFCHGYNILVMMPFPMYSHTKSYMPLFVELAKRGHNVTMVSQFPLKDPVPNFNEVIIQDTMKKRVDNEKFDPRKLEWFLWRLLGPRMFCKFMLDGILEAKSLQAFLNDTDSKFDMVVTETFFCQEPFIALGHKYGAVQVSVQTISLFMGLARATGNPQNPAYMPMPVFPMTHNMNFWQRSKNTFVNLLDYLISHTGWMYLDYWMRSRFSEFPGFENLPPIVDMFKNISLVLVDNQMAITYPRPYLPNVVEIGGLTITGGDKLDDEWEKYLNESVDGVIYFSWGSHYKTENMRPHELTAFMSAFGKLKQRVLMKADEDSIPGKPDNVRLAKWVPQASILGHPNLRAFVSHGGLHGVLEGTYHGVPIVGTPLFADQKSNIKFCEEAGYCINIDLDTVTEEILLDAFNKILTNSSYKEIAVTRSKIMRDKPLSIMDNAVYWMEYVLRHRGAPHLRSAAVELSWYQYLLLDVIVVWGAVFVMTIVLLRKIIRSICNARRSKSKKD
ncbi:UDP-glycosyltransferase UGT5 [Halyomorpha halys]|uniref:UDP-glycosyltransferase UGT5 n=1 Tax=Halyomorpha halys TaxID=286706 RepID=UPI0006D5233D|nr:UDP-glucuronosyltransferase 2C1 [Halyomorpha halys]XP_014289139.1 UDP-glucuronosyltransferase 2C1 [Halyomorpha halys]XP_024216286.1 UDP-glucuronosyltransferase 2C1 [Halyomorpha halys]XP_024216287.1 UDP-glucuronosyltransferase 2C1 [Halyomorpha halys]